MASSDRWDYAVIQVSADGGVWESLSQSYSTGDDWKGKRLHMTSYSGKKIRIRLSFDAVDDFFNNFEGWYIDDLKVIADLSQAPPTANTAPAASPVDAVVDEDGSVPISLIATYSEQCGPAFALVSGPSNGFLEAMGESTCTFGSPYSSQALVNYNPNPNFSGSDSLTNTNSVYKRQH